MRKSPLVACPPRSSEFVISAAAPGQFPRTDLPEIAFAGRSNVGKSSLLNMLVGRRALARTSSTPGKTQQINFFRLDEAIHFVDLPGYGFAKVSKSDRESWARLIESYLTNRNQLRLVVSLIDIRHPPTSLDFDMFSWLDSVGVAYVVVLTKYDKVSAAAAAERESDVRQIAARYPRCLDVIPISSETRHNRDLLWRTLMRACFSANDS